MSQEAVSADVTGAESGSISNDAVEAFFESGGKEVPEGSEKPTVVETETKSRKKAEKNSEKIQQEQKEEVKETKAPEKEQKNAEEEENYKRMAHEERQKRQELKARVEKMESVWSDLQQRAALQQQQEMLRQQQAQIPSYEENPLDHLRYQNATLAQQLKAHNEYMQRQYQIQQQAAIENEFVEQYGNDIKKYWAETQPDLDKAYKFVEEAQLRRYRAAGYNDVDAKKYLQHDERQLVAKARLDGVNPGQRIYEYAKAIGYQAEPVASQAQPQLPVNPQITQKLDNIERGMKESLSIKNAGNQNTSLTFSQIADMDPDELNDFVNNEWEKLAKLMR